MGMRPVFLLWLAFQAECCTRHYHHAFAFGPSLNCPEPIPLAITTSTTSVNAQKLDEEVGRDHPELSSPPPRARVSSSRRTIFQQVAAGAAFAAAASTWNIVTTGVLPLQWSSVAWAEAVTSSVSKDPDPVIFDLLPQFSTVDDVPSSYFDENRYIYAFVERVIDGDTIRVRHVPGFGFGKKAPQPLQQRGIANDTLSIRIYGVDTPETGKNKRKTSQPFGEEAEAFTKKLIFHRMVKVTFLRRDQYGRAVAQVETVEDSMFSSPKDLTMELARAGLAELYTGGGAQYFGKRREIEQAIEQAKAARRGIWSLEDRVSAAEYKRAEREGAPIAASSDKQSNTILLASAYDDAATNPVVNCQDYSANRKKYTNIIANHLLDVAVTGLEIAPIQL